MSKVVQISDIAQFEDQEVTIQGWLYNKRSSGKLRFLLVRDGSETIQCVVFKMMFQNNPLLMQMRWPKKAHL